MALSSTRVRKLQKEGLQGPAVFMVVLPLLFRKGNSSPRANGQDTGMLDFGVKEG